MSKRTKAIFAGTSNTMGLGMELELSPRFQDDKYLENVKNIPPMEHESGDGYETYTNEDLEIHRKYRWPNIVCKHFGLEEININDPIKDHPLEFLWQTRQAVDIVFDLYDRREDEEVKKLLSETKYIFLEFGYIRWWEDQLHGVNTEFKWPSTPAEIERFLDDKNVSNEDKQKAIDWLNNVNPIELWERTLFRIKEMVNEFKDIEFILLSWGINADIFNLDSTMELIDKFVPMVYNESKQETYDIGSFLAENKLQILDVAKAYNPKYQRKWMYMDHHANSEGHRLIANQIIKKLQNETRGLYSI